MIILLLFLPKNLTQVYTLLGFSVFGVRIRICGLGSIYVRKLDVLIHHYYRGVYNLLKKYLGDGNIINTLTT